MFLVVWLCVCVVCGCVISAVFFLVGDGINHPLPQQVEMDKIAKKVIPNAHSAERNPKGQCDIHQGNTDHVYFLTRKCYCAWHTHLQKMLRVYNLQGTIFHDGKNQMQDDACVYLNS